MQIISVKENSKIAETVKDFCKQNWNKVYDAFSNNVDKSLSTNTLFPQTWVLVINESVRGFYQIVENEQLSKYAEYTPFIGSLYVDSKLRGEEIGELLLTHAKYEVSRLGFDRVYVTTDHIGYYEKYGFKEIGLDTCPWGATKVYVAETPQDIKLVKYDKDNPKSDELQLELARLRGWKIGLNPAVMLYKMKHWGVPETHTGRWFSIVAYKNNKVIGMVNFMQNPDNPLNWYLGDLFVDMQERRKKIASKMIKKGIEIISSKASGGEFVYAYIEKDNIASRNLHSSLAFKDLDRLEPFDEFIFDENETTWVYEV